MAADKMCYSSFIVIFNIFIVSCVSSSNYMESLEVVPDVINKAPADVLEVTYDGGIKVDQGKELTPTQVKNEPQVHYNADPESFYVLAMTDPDAPSRQEPTSREFKHWLVGNIPGSHVSAGEVIAEYIGSGPPKGTGLHRYVFLLYKQPNGKITFNETKSTNRSRVGRPNFSIRRFAEKYNLGEPIAGNVYQAQWDSYVPIIHQQLSAGAVKQ